MPGMVDAKNNNGSGVRLDRLLGKRRNNRTAHRSLSRLSRRKGTIRNRKHALARWAAGALHADSAIHVPRKAADLRADERDGEGVDRRRSSPVFRFRREDTEARAISRKWRSRAVAARPGAGAAAPLRHLPQS